MPESVDVASTRLSDSRLLTPLKSPWPLPRHYRVNNQPELIDQLLVQKACDEGRPADDIDVLPRLVLEGSQLRDVSDDFRSRPRDALERRGQNDVGCLGSQPCVLDFTL